MRLIGYGAGEILDRLSILALKISHKPAKHFTDEFSDLLDKIPTEVYHVPSREAIKLAIQLATVNGRLWVLEDLLRGIREGRVTAPDAREVAFRIQEFNDERASLIEQMNKAAGHHHGEEKIR